MQFFFLKPHIRFCNIFSLSVDRMATIYYSLIPVTYFMGLVGQVGHSRVRRSFSLYDISEDGLNEWRLNVENETSVRWEFKSNVLPWKLGRITFWNFEGTVPTAPHHLDTSKTVIAWWMMRNRLILYNVYNLLAAVNFSCPIKFLNVFLDEIHSHYIDFSTTSLYGFHFWR